MKIFEPKNSRDLKQKTPLSSHYLYRVEKSRLVLQLNYAVWAIVVFYCFFYYIIGAFSAFKVLLFGALILSPLSLFLEYKKYEILPRFLLIISCNFYIFLTGISFRNEVNTEFYYLPATMLALLVLYEYEDRFKSYIGIFMPLIFWILQISFEHSFIGESWYAPSYNINILKMCNFIGSFLISLIFVNLFRKSLYKLQIQMNLQSEEKQEELAHVIELLEQNTKYMEQAQHVARMGNWHYQIAHKKMIWSKEMYKIFSLSSEVEDHLKFHHYLNYIHPSDKDKLDQQLSRCLENGSKCSLQFRLLSDEKNLEKFKWLEAKAEGEFSEDGLIVGLFGTCQDITERLKLENSIEDQRSFLDIVLNNVPSMIFVKDFQQNLSFSLFNKAGEELLGLNKEELIGKNDFDLFPKEQAEFFVAKDKEVFEKKKVLRIEQEEIQTPKGIRILLTQKVPTYDREGNNKFLIGISSDITEEVKAQENLATERAKSLHQSKLMTLGEMAAGMAHEINNPLAIIDGMVNLIPTSTHSPEKLKERLNSIQKAIYRISKIISGLKKFSRSSTELYRKNCSINEILSEVLILTKAKKERHEVDIILDIVQDTSLNCDDVEIEQVFVNLINNAIDAVKELEVRWIKIYVFTQGKKLIIQVLDSGQGIDSEIKERIFNPFFTTKKVGEGTGLGLSISKGIVEGHLGTIELKFIEDRTCFEIILPLA